ncbi:Clp protease N-terminal domain-containing protein [Streptomyces sp. NPDC048481]|uniref:Clp protease N-terminal domain-containing protein n=1 Tax=Streptomyces sp. NPDC048481 TaxID=3365557 RepID=UPI003713CAFC
MQPRIPRQPPRDQAAPGPHDVPRLGAEAAAALAAARRRAARDGDPQVDTAHLLHSLLEHDPQVRAAFDDGAPRLARLLGYLVQRSIGYGLRWRSAVEDCGPALAVTVVEPSGATAVEGLSPLAAAAVERACEESARHAGAPARGVGLLAAMLADPGARAAEVLAHAGIDVDALRARIEDGLHGREECLEGGSSAC